MEKLPSFIHVFPKEIWKEVYGCQYRFLGRSGLGFTTRPKMYSVILTNDTSLILQKAEKKLAWGWDKNYKDNLEPSVDYFQFAIQIEDEGAQFFKFEKHTDIHSVSLLKFCGPLCNPLVSLNQVVSCNRRQDLNCITRVIEERVSDTTINMSKYIIEIDSQNMIRHATSDSYFNGDLIKQHLKISSNFSTYLVQDLLANQLFKGLPVLDECKGKHPQGLIYITIFFVPVVETDTDPVDSRSFVSLLNAEGFTFLTCDGMKSETDFTGYLEPFDTNIWLLTLCSLRLVSFTMSIKLYNAGKMNFLDYFLNTLCMNLSYLTGVSNISLDSMLRDVSGFRFV
jgi:hypothetical protein